MSKHIHLMYAICFAMQHKTMQHQTVTYSKHYMKHQIIVSHEEKLS